VACGLGWWQSGEKQTVELLDERWDKHDTKDAANIGGSGLSG